eukprot:391467-Ditylum_brightwellii.AAC.1
MWLADLGRNWSLINDEDRPLARFRGHFHQGELAITTAHNTHDKILGKYQVGGTASITTGNLVGKLDGKGGQDPS